MASRQMPISVAGHTDGEDRLVSADAPLLDLNRACGGELGATLAIPELLSLVVKTRDYGFRTSRKFTAVTQDSQIAAWADIAPSGQGGGCELIITDWKSEPLRQEAASEIDARRAHIHRHLAECTARLDPSQGLLSIETDAPDLVDFARAAGEVSGRPWTDFVVLEGGGPEQPRSWQLLDGATCRIPGSDREWTAYLEPLGRQNPGSAGFVLHLASTQPMTMTATERRSGAPSLGHDLTPILRQPVNRIIANAETIRTKLAGPLQDQYSDYAGDIAIAGQHLLALIDDIADLEVVEAEDFSTAPDRIDLADVARRACGILGVKAAERGIVLDPPAQAESQLAVAEFRRVLQVLLNLVNNAIRYSPEQSRVWLRLDASEDMASITVADEGHGLDESQQARVFDKFERLGKGNDGGSGLGLYISRRIARAMGGDLTVESAPGQGARFTLLVPSTAN